MTTPQVEKAFKKLVSRYIDEAVYVQNITDESPFFPQQIHIEPTNACNLRCVHCHHHIPFSGEQKIKRPFGLMSMDVFRKVVDEVSPNCQITLDVQGEPTLHSDLLDMVAYAKDKGLFTSLFDKWDTLDRTAFAIAN